MSRIFNLKEFNQVFDNFIIKGRFNENPNYYKIYKNRYETIINYFCDLVDDKKKVNILDIGGGQYAMICKQMWNDYTVVADIDNRNFDYLSANQINTVNCDLLKGPISVEEKFDIVFFSEVLGHLPIPAHIILSNIREIMEQGGHLILSTPNLYRIRNVIYLALGKPLFGYFTYSDNALGRFFEYSKDHIEWQLKTAGFEHYKIFLKQLTNKRSSKFHSVLGMIGQLFLLVPRFRDNLIAIAKK